MENIENELLTVEQAAIFLGISQIHLRKFLKDGAIKYVNITRGKTRQSIRIPKTEINNFIKNGGVNHEFKI